MTLHSRSRQGWALLAGCAVTLPLLLAQGCPGVGGTGGVGSPVVVVRSPSLDQTISAGQLVTVVYDASLALGGSVAVSAFYDRDGIAGSGDETVFKTDLASGESKFTQLSTAGLTPGTLYVGISASASGGTTIVYASAKITISGSPVLVFTSPASNISVGAGVGVPLRFNAGAGITDFAYRTFYDLDNTFDGDEITISSGSSAASNVSTTFDTSALGPGTYYVGARVTTSTGGAVTGYANGTITIVTGAFVQLLEPAVGLIAQPGTPIDIVVAASDPSHVGSTIRIFFDVDNNSANGNDTTIVTIPVTGSTATWDTTNVLPGDYYVGAELQNGQTPSLVSYTDGPVSLVTGSGQLPGGGTGGTGSGTSLLTITTPLVATTILEGTVYRINWRTNLRAGEGVITVFREPDLNLDGIPDGVNRRVTIGNPGLDARTQFVDFNTLGVRGTFFIGATVTPNVGAAVTAYAPTGATLTIRPLQFWVGDLDTRKNSAGVVIPQSGPFQGAVFRGFNIGDNLGSAMIGTPDYDGDSRREVLLAAQFGKPFIFGAGGRGAGEAYLVYSPGQRFSGSLDVNRTGQPTLPGLIFSGIVPNPWPGDTGAPNLIKARAGTSIPYTVDGLPSPAYASEGLRSVTLIPDQDGDGKPELAFGFPWCNSYSLENQYLDGMLRAPIPGMGRLENNGQFLRGGVVIVSSRNSQIYSRTALSRSGERVMQLHEVGQMFDEMHILSAHVVGIDVCPKNPGSPDGVQDTYSFTCEGFWQNTVRLTTTGMFSGAMDPPRLADPLFPRNGSSVQYMAVPSAGPGSACFSTAHFLSLSQIDAPPGPADPLFLGTLVSGDPGTDNYCNTIQYPPAGRMQTVGSGFFYAEGTGSTCATRVMAGPLEPYGCRILGQTTTQPLLATTANRFGSSLSISGNHLLISAPQRTVERSDIPILPTVDRASSGEIYMLSMTTYWASQVPAVPPPVLTQPWPTPWPNAPSPHNYVIRDVGYWRLEGGSCAQAYRGTPSLAQNPDFEMTNPVNIVGAAPGDEVDFVTGLHDINADGIEDFAIGSPLANVSRGAVYIIYRRPPEIEGDYLLERLQLAPTSLERLNGVMIIGEIGENLGGAIAGGGSRNDDYNNDGYADVLIGIPNASASAGFHAGQVLVVFGGKNLLSPVGGFTAAQLRASGDGMLLTGARAGDAAGTSVASAGDVNGDGVADLLIAAPDASPRFIDINGVEQTGLDYNNDGVRDDLDKSGSGVNDTMVQAGLVYVVFGGTHLTGTIPLDQIGTPNLPGFVVVGRKAGDHMGGGLTQNNLASRGVISAGDLDGDNREDLLISSVLADPEGKTDAGEIYVVYGLKP